MSIQHSPRKPKGAGAERREEILAASLRLFGQYGLYGVSTRMIAQAVGISQPTLYAYFSVKADIAAELHRRAFEQLHTRLQRMPEEVSTEAEMAQVLRTYIDFGLENPDAYRVAFMMEVAPGREGADPQADLSTSGHATFGLLQTCINSLHRRGLAADDDPERLAQSLWAGMHGLVSLVIARPKFPWRAREALLSGHVALLARGAMRAV